MADREEIVRDLTTIFQDTFDDPTIELFDEMTAADIDDWDSLQHIVLTLAIERKFRLKLNPAEVGKLENVGRMIDLLLTKRSART